MAKAKDTKKEVVKKSVLRGVRMTEKAALQTDKRSIYAFNVATDATKAQIMAAMKAEYKVTPLSIRLLAVPTKNKMVRGKWGVKGGGKKAYVYLKKGDKIEA